MMVLRSLIPIPPFSLLLLVSLLATAFGQQDSGYTWWNPASGGIAAMEGQAWPGSVEKFYERLPAGTKVALREGLWAKSRQSTGLIVRFRSNSPSVHVRYQVTEKLEFEHMPATGVSGLDLYALSSAGEWEWCGADYVFGETIKFNYDHLRGPEERDYFLYLPLYNTVKILEIGVTKESSFTPRSPRREHPVVVYGTSIAQGGCASRPGLAWPAILGRRLKIPVINLGFSSNGLLEKPIVALMKDTNACIYILDCFPNLIEYPAEEVKKSLSDAVRDLRSAKPNVPIVITEHADSSINSLNGQLSAKFKSVNATARLAFEELQSAGVEHLHYLSAETIALDIDSTVDGQHPNDLGMFRYAEAYAGLLRGILHH